MTICLPNTLSSFRSAFDEACDRILKSKEDNLFYTLLVQLTNSIQSHPLMKAYIQELENELTKQKEELSKASLEALEDSWSRLWKYHPHGLKQKKQLVRIKQMVTAPYEISCSSIYYRILYALNEFRYCSVLLRLIDLSPKLFRTVNSELRCKLAQLDYRYPLRELYFTQRRITLYKLSKKNKLHLFYENIINHSPSETTTPSCKIIKHIELDHFFSPKIAEIERKSSIPGRNSHEKRLNMQITAETSSIFCWERIQFLNRCYTINETSLPLKPSKGSWKKVRETSWQSTSERCDIEVLLGAKMALGQKLSPDLLCLVDSFLNCKHQVHRGDYERYLRSFKIHIHNQLYNIENIKQSHNEDSQFPLPGTLKGNWVIDHAPKYWKNHPSANQQDVFDDYRLRCPFKLRLSRTRWEQILRKHNLDPRPKASKKRGKGKKTLQN